MGEKNWFEPVRTPSEPELDRGPPEPGVRSKVQQFSEPDPRSSSRFGKISRESDLNRTAATLGGKEESAKASVCGGA